MPPCPPPRRLRALRRDDSAPMWRRPPPPLPRRKLGRRITHAPWRGVRGVGDVDASAWKHQHLGTDAAPTGPKSGDCTCVSRGAAATPVEGSSPQVTFVEAPDQLMPGFDPENGKLAQRILINPRKIDYHTGVFARKITPAKDGKPVLIELIDAKTKEHKETLEVDAAPIAPGRAPFTKGLGLENINAVTQRGFVPVDEQMQVMDADGSVDGG